MRFLVLFLVVVFSLYADTSRNRSGLADDTAQISDFSVDSLKYTRWFDLSGGEDIRVVLKVDDTSSTGFASDSFAIEWGFQTGCPVFDSSFNAKNEAVLPDEKIVLDTLVSDSLGKLELGYGSMTSAGVITRNTKQVDTTNVPGYACMPRWFTPEWDVFIRFWVRGLAGTTGSFVDVRFDVQRRQYVLTRKN